MCSRESLGISQQLVPGPWGLLPISASSQGTKVSSLLSLDSSGASVTWDGHRNLFRGSMAFSLLKNNRRAPLQVDWCGQLSLTKESLSSSSLSSPAPASSILDRLHWTAISWRLGGATNPQLDITGLSWSFSLPWVEFH